MVNERAPSALGDPLARDRDFENVFTTTAVGSQEEHDGQKLVLGFRR